MVSKKVSERFYSKIEVQALRSLFASLVEAIKAQPKADPDVLMKGISQYNRTFLRQFMGIQRILFDKKSDHTVIIVGLEDRVQNYTIKVVHGIEDATIIEEQPK